MGNLVLYRKYRPQTFKEIIGQEHIVKIISNAILNNMVSHAYLFSGPRGSGKTTIARILAKAVNCRERKSDEFEPCNKCSSCVEIIENRSLDVIEIDAASNRGIDEIRELRDGIKFSPVKEKYKVFIIDESHQLTKEAFNALLKILEEPPSHVIFILATTEIHKMIPTIVSRCQRFDFKKLTVSEIIKRLKFICQKENVNIDNSVFEMIALNSGGSIRDAESLLDQVLTFSIGFNKDKIIKASDIKELFGIVDINFISSFVDFLIDKKTSEAINVINEIFERGYDISEFLKSLINYLRNIMIMKINPNIINHVIIGFTKEEQEKIRSQSEKIKSEELQSFLNIFIETENKMKYSSISQLPLELAVIDITLKKDKD